ncbi:MAG: TlpA family protein disulfide reductase [Proteobacteria bacterium]|nr:TlpA family protein disulfide reductase [Pseudomonadota bacterium]
MKRILAALSAGLLLAGIAGAAIVPKPTLKLTTLDGTTFDLAAHKGEWVIVNFWATWCSPCIKELPDISAYVTSHKGKVAAIGLAYEDSDKADIEAFLKAHPLSYPVAQLDVMAPPKDFDTPKGLPNTYLIAPDGSVAKVFLGPIQMKDLDAIIVKP